MDNLAVFIMVHGRPDKMWTYNTLRKCGYTGKIFLVADNLDKTLQGYKERYGNELLVFDKKEAAKEMDSGDNSGDLRSTLFAANKIFDLAKENNIKHYFIMCDDYTSFNYALLDADRSFIKNLNNIFSLMVKFYENTEAKAIAFAQTGDMIGGIDNGKGAYRFSKRKVMNTFLCSTERRFKFIGRMNEDVSTYVNLGTKGALFLTIPTIVMSQKDTQQVKKGLTEMYLDNGTYTKSFFSVMYNPSCVKVAMMNAKNTRIHHSIKWINTTPMIIKESYKR
jgi:hypothetical protein